MTWPPIGWVAQPYNFAGQSTGTKLEIIRSTCDEFLDCTMATEISLEYPWDNPIKARGMFLSQSRCALFAAGILRCIGVEHPSLDRPYWEQWRVLNAVTRLEVIGRDLGVWSGRDTVPRAGDIAIIGTGMGTHALVCVDVKNDPTWNPGAVVSVDGGRRTPRKVERSIVPRNGAIGLVDMVMGWRRVHGLIRTVELEPRGEWFIPRKVTNGEGKGRSGGGMG